MHWDQAIVLGLVQGLTEFLPVSSTAHLRIVPYYLGWEDPGTSFSAVLQLGTLIAVFFYFLKDIKQLIIGALDGLRHRNIHQSTESLLAWSIAAGTLPIAVFGLSFRDYIETEARGLSIISISLIGLAIALIFAERIGQRKLSMHHLSFWKIQCIGFCQALALIPGCSRSGSTIMGGLLCGLERREAAHFSFLLGLPAILASGLFELYKLTENGLENEDMINIIIGVSVAFFSGYFTIGLLLRFIGRFGSDLFSIYRILLGISILFSSHI